jgi:hypothetical protein
MTHLELTKEDAEMLAEVLESALSDLRYEISNTDSFDYREGLKLRKATLMNVLGQLSSVPRQMV